MISVSKNVIYRLITVIVKTKFTVKKFLIVLIIIILWKGNVHA